MIGIGSSKKMRIAELECRAELRSLLMVEADVCPIPSGGSSDEALNPLQRSLTCQKKSSIIAPRYCFLAASCIAIY